MQENHLLLPSAKSAVLVRAKRGREQYVRLGAVVIGIFCVLVGAADVTARLVERVGPDAAFLAFAPAAAIDLPAQAGDPALLGVAASTGSITPARLRIPSLGVNAAVEPVGIKDDGTMGTPKNFDNVSWYSSGAKPGGQGSAVFAGHVNNALLKSGVFEHLSQIKAGEYITVEDAAGKALVYRVSSVDEYPADSSSEGLFATAGPSRLVLITCDGTWIPSARTYDKRLVVVAEPA